MTEKVKKPTAKEVQEALAAKNDYWKGQTRYIKIDEGERIVLPEYVGTPYWCPEGLTREICKGIAKDAPYNPIWIVAPDAPVPAGQFNVSQSVAYTRATENHAQPSPPFDYRPPAYASDTQSGGPANFDGNMGGMDNPRTPEMEGEVPGERDEALAKFQQVLAAASANAA